MKKLFLVLLAGALFVACGNKAEEATEEVVEEPVVEEVAVVEEETTVKEEAQKAGKTIAKKAIQKGTDETVKAIENTTAPEPAPANLQNKPRR